MGSCAPTPYRPADRPHQATTEQLGRAAEDEARALWALLIETIAAFGAARDEVYTPDAAARGRIAAVVAAAPFGPEHWRRGADHQSRLTEDPEFFAPHTPALRRLTARSLLIRGELDALPSAEELQALRSARPDAEIRTFPGSGHFVHAERPEECADLVRGFLKA
ncbi:Alpha/beta hydrolase family protein [Paractinoplanes atraurantiacus]|uniref:Alpha/beta hydrolase family protein n=1 Tax=Paractinoplanes atraurantiacus TaxID=1036182 RepID=A0A285J7V1_9ACTN|nr:Alpha/beta hydrolase family protein [Actinoplanes atraurantiacus]